MRFKKFVAAAVVLIFVPGCVSASETLTEREAVELSDHAKADALAVLDDVLGAAGLSTTDPPQESAMDSCRAVDFTSDGIDQWQLLLTVPLEPGAEDSTLDQISTSFASQGEWRVIGDEPDEIHPDLGTVRLLWPTDTANDLRVEVEVDPIANTLQLEVLSDCYLTRPD